MKLNTVLVQALVGISSTLAAPVPFTESSSAVTQASSLFTRQALQETCGGHTYAIRQLGAARVRATQLTASGNHVLGDNGKEYPEVFNNIEGFGFSACPNPPRGSLREFPILENNMIFAAGDAPGLDRIVYSATGRGANGHPNVFTYCGAITHKGAGAGQFEQCSPP